MLVERCRCDEFAAKIDLLDDLMYQASLNLQMIQAMPSGNIDRLNRLYLNIVETAAEANLPTDGLQLDETGQNPKEAILHLGNTILESLEDEYLRIDELWAKALAQ